MNSYPRSSDKVQVGGESARHPGIEQQLATESSLAKSTAVPAIRISDCEERPQFGKKAKLIFNSSREDATRHDDDQWDTRYSRPVPFSSAALPSVLIKFERSEEFPVKRESKLKP